MASHYFLSVLLIFSDHPAGAYRGGSARMFPGGKLLFPVSSLAPVAVFMGIFFLFAY